jgi:hypothetical protein
MWEGSGRLQEALHQSGPGGGDMWGWPALPAGRPAYRPLRYSPNFYGCSPPTLRLHLRCSLSRFDPRAHIASSGLYKQTLAPLRHKSFEKTETLIILRAPIVSSA